MKNKDVTFDDLLDRLWGFDFEVTKYDWLLVCKKYRTRERVVFHNNPRNDLWEWLNKEQPILIGYNTKNYDQYILKGILTGLDTTDVKRVNDYIIGGGNGWELDYPEKIEMPPIWDLMQQLKTYKSLKELEGNLGLSIVESSVDFNIDHKWTKEEYDEMLFYCSADVEALFPIFNYQIKDYKSKYVIARLAKMDYAKALGMTNANLTAVYLNARKREYDDWCKYEYPDVVDKSKIPKEFLDYIDDIIAHNDPKYTGNPPLLDVQAIDFQVGLGGGHGFTKKGGINYHHGNKTFMCDNNWKEGDK